MKSLSTFLTAICIALLSIQTTAIAYDLTLHTTVATDLTLDTTVTTDYTFDVPEQPRLILALNVKELARYLNRTDTYTAQYDTPKNLETASNVIQINSVSRKLKSASKAFKRITSLRGKNGQKIRAKIGKSSLTLKYTRPL